MADVHSHRTKRAASRRGREATIEIGRFSGFSILRMKTIIIARIAKLESFT